MSDLIFPPVSIADEHGLLGIGGEATVNNLVAAYSEGIFPWPWSDEYIAWFSPPLRAVLEFSSLHVSRSLKKAAGKNRYEMRKDYDFHAVITACGEATNRKGQKGTWITEDIYSGYEALHEQGLAHSFEAYEDNQLVGGLYGVKLGRYFSGESMFYIRDNASKLALLFAVESLRKEGVTWMDCQVLTDTTQQFGAIEIPRAQFIAKLKAALP